MEVAMVHNKLVELKTKPLLETIDTQNQAIEQKEKQLQTQKPFVQFALKIQKSDGVVDIKTAAKWLDMESLDIEI